MIEINLHDAIEQLRNIKVVFSKFLNQRKLANSFYSDRHVK